LDRVDWPIVPPYVAGRGPTLADMSELDAFLERLRAELLRVLAERKSSRSRRAVVRRRD
jgi:hypothetical protein